MTKKKKVQDPTKLSKSAVLELIEKALKSSGVSVKLRVLLVDRIEDGLSVYPGTSITEEFAYELIYSLKHLLQHGMEHFGVRPGRKFEIVDIETFVCDSEYMGQKDFVRPAILAELKKLFEDRYRYHEVVCGGCISYDMLIQEADGGLPTLQERLCKVKSKDVLIAKDSGIEVSTTDGTRPSGSMKALQIDLTNGMQLKCSYDHKVHVYKDGYEMLSADKLDKDYFVVCPRHIKTAPTSFISNEEARLLGYWSASGCFDHKRARYSGANTSSVDDVLFCLRKLGFDGAIFYADERYKELYVIQNKKSGFYDWINDKVISATKKTIVPNIVCKSGNIAISHFLNAVWACNGTVYGGTKKSAPRFILAMASERYIRQIQLLLLRFGIQSRIKLLRQFDKRVRKTTYVWELSVQGKSNLSKFIDNIGFVLGKEEKCSVIYDYCFVTKSNTNVDILPITYGELSSRMISAGIVRGKGSKWHSLNSTKYCYISRDLFQKWLSDYENTVLGRELVSEFPDDLSFIRIKTINPLQKRIEVGDIGAYNGNRYLANGISVHNSIGIGKNYFTDMAMSYILYDLSSYHSPQLEFGLAPGSSIVFMMQSASIKLAKSVMYNQFKAKIALSPYFTNKFPFDKKVRTELRFPNDIVVMPLSSTDTSALGLNIFGGAQDEMSFQPVVSGSKKRTVQGGSYDQAEVLYTTVMRRIESRFMVLGRIPGKLFLIGSASYPNNFIDRKIQKVRLLEEAGEKSNTFVMAMSQWESLPSSRFSGETFRIELPSENSSGKILNDTETVVQDAEVKDVPIEYKEKFQEDFDGSLRDIAGIATGNVSKFIKNVEKISLAAKKHDDIFECKQLFVSEEIDQRVYSFKEMVRMDYITKHLDSHTKMGIHIDLALTGDRVGIAVGRVFGFTKSKSEDLRSTAKEILPIFCIDGAVSIVPPPNKEINLFSIRDLILYLKEHLNIVFATMDSYESAMMMQSFRSHRISSTVQSVDRTPEPYKDFKTAILSERIIYPNSSLLLKELRGLLRDPATGKIDHPTGRGRDFSKDISDCVASIVYRFSRSKASYKSADHSRPISNRPQGSYKSPTETSRVRRIRADYRGKLI